MLHLPRQLTVPTAQEELSAVTNTSRTSTSQTKTSPATTAWFSELDKLNKILKPRPEDTESMQNLIKIALIQAGIPQTHKQSNRFKFKDFTQSENLSKDNTNHGGASVDLIFEVFSRADLYAANIPHDVDPEMPNIIAKVWCLLKIFFCFVNRTWAIKWALDCKVDIIAIPMGVHTISPDLHDAVYEAADKHVLIFASATTGQGGFDRQIPYPARLRKVFCIFATDGNGMISNFNPPPRPSTLNFAILGESVKLPQWKEPISGTFVSTAIATGLCAALLEFAHQRDPLAVIGKEGLRCMHSMEGMMNVFFLMSRRENGYACLVPWDLIPSDVTIIDTPRLTISREISMALRRTDSYR